MLPKKIIGGELLFHPVHGLCRVDRASGQTRSGKKDLCYSLVPKITPRMKVRFFVPDSDMAASGFHRIISSKEANGILDYLKAGDSSGIPINQTWALARNILAFSVDRLKTKDQRKRQLLEHSIKGLVGELAYVLKISLKETAARIEKSLSKVPKTDPLVFAVLERAAEE